MAITIFMVTIVGGVGTIIGPVGGAYLLIIMNELLRGIGEVRLLIYAVITIVIYLLLPHGMVRPVITLIMWSIKRMLNVFGIGHRGFESHGVSENQRFV
jgi:branched-chain amino acid transport system permease protein